MSLDKKFISKTGDRRRNGSLEVRELREVHFPEGDPRYSKEFQGRPMIAYQVYYSQNNSFHWFIDSKKLNSYEVDYLKDSHNGHRIPLQRRKSKQKK